MSILDKLLPFVPFSIPVALGILAIYASRERREVVRGRLELLTFLSYKPKNPAAVRREMRTRGVRISVPRAWWYLTLLKYNKLANSRPMRRVSLKEAGSVWTWLKHRFVRQYCLTEAGQRRATELVAQEERTRKHALNLERFFQTRS